MGQLFTIPAGVPFLPALAEGLLSGAVAGVDASGPEGLSGVTVLLPTRRAARGLVEALIEANDGKALLLPQIRPIGDVDDDLTLADPEVSGPGGAALNLKPEISPVHRTLALARCIMAHAEKTGLGPRDPAQAVPLANELARLMDAFATEEADLSKLPAIVPDGFSDYWKMTLKFLEVMTDVWPQMLDSLGRADPASRRSAMIDALTVSWTKSPPGPVIAAGSTGSIPATARLLTAIAGMDEGAVVLPGLDMHLDDAAWAALGPEHPQFGMGELLAKMSRTRADVAVWPAGTTRDEAAARTMLTSEALRPADTTDQWRDAGARLTPDVMTTALSGYRLIDADTPQTEALAIAIALREALETPGRTAALVTPDRTLARRVKTELERWHIEVDDTGGVPLAHTAPGAFMVLVAEMVADRFAPVPMLAALKHPQAATGTSPARFRSMVRALETAVLRGVRPAPGIKGLRAALDEAAGGAIEAVDRLERATGDFAALMVRETAPFRDLLQAHLSACEALAASDDESGPSRMWAREAGETAAGLAAELMEHAAALEDVPCASYPHLFTALMAGRMVRPVRRSHPRLQILGPLEARLQHWDLLVLGGLNEGVWPVRPETDAWVNRPMRAALGLSSPERQIGLAAHDIAQGLAAPEVILTRAQKKDGQPTVPSRWWLRLENLIDGLGGKVEDGPWHAWAATRDRAKVNAVPAARPAPCPPLDARPRKLSVTRIERLVRDPYAIYAQYVLKLRVLDDLDAEPGAADRGNLIHDTLEEFSKAYPGPMPEEALAKLIALGEEQFAAHGDRPNVRAIWWPRFLDVAAWFVPFEAERRARIAETHVEIKGAHEMALPGGAFTLEGRADRIDVLADRTLAILDYKTGKAPSEKQTRADFSPQLPLEAAMAKRGAFPGIPSLDTSELAYVELRGGAKEPGKLVPVTDAMEQAERSFASAADLLARFDDGATAYPSQPRPQFIRYEGDYDHLARVLEWQTQTLED